MTRLRWALSHLLGALAATAVVLAVVGIAAGLVDGQRTGDVGGSVGRLLGAALVDAPRGLGLRRRRGAARRTRAAPDRTRLGRAHRLPRARRVRGDHGPARRGSQRISPVRPPARSCRAAPSRWRLWSDSPSSARASPRSGWPGCGAATSAEPRPPGRGESREVRRGGTGSAAHGRTVYPLPMTGIDGFWAVIPAGGSGTRLWPLSRRDYPKFLHDLTGSGRRCCATTYDRLEPLAGDRILVVTGAAHLEAVRGQLPMLPRDAVVAEPSPATRCRPSAWPPRSSSGATPRRCSARSPPTTSSPTSRPSAARSRRPSCLARRGELVTIGIEPTRPATGLRLHPPGRAARRRGRAARHGASPTSSRSLTRRPRSATSPAANTVGTQACSSSAPRRCSRCSPRSTPR